MSGYTPTTEEVRDGWEVLMYEGGFSAAARKDADFDSGRARGQFDRWLAEVERAAAEKAWGEGAMAQWKLGQVRRIDSIPTNPYRKASNDEQN